MKKILAILMISFVSILSVFASFDYKFDLFSLTPLYEEYNGDRERAGMDFQYACVYDGFPEYIYQGTNKFPFKENEPLRLKPFIAIYHVGETLSAFKNTFTFDSWFSPISFDFSFSGSLIGAMEGEVADTIGYDGIFFYGASASIADMFSFRFGGSHHCSHYGDGTYKQLEADGSVPADFNEWFKYLRMDSLLFGFSVEPVDFMRLYFDINFNKKNTNVLPEIFRPSWSDYYDPSVVDGIPSSYGARIINFGVEFEYPLFKKLGMTRLSYHCRAHEEGKIVYKIEELEASGRNKPFYDPKRPWEFEHTINLSQDLGELVSLDLTWHYGRFILNAYYATRSSYISIGARINFDGGITLYDSGK